MQRIIGSFLTAALIAGALAACSSGSSTSTATTAAPPATPVKMKTAKSMASANGAAVFTTNCASCHASDGKGGAGPPLAGNALVTGNPAKVIHIVMTGLTGSVQVNGKTYNSIMPAWKGVLSNSDIAAAITYIRSSWGNKASAVTSAQVASTP